MLRRATCCLLLYAAAPFACNAEAGAGSAETGGSGETTTGRDASSTTLGDASSSTTSADVGDTGDTGAESTSADGSSSTGASAEEWEWDLPENIPAPRVPEDNPMSAAKVELGRHLFYDPRLSANQTQSCSSCHFQELAFTDGLATPVGSTGEHVPANSMALVNVAYNATYTWASPLELTLSSQAALPLFGDSPIELGSHLDEDGVFQRVKKDPVYGMLFSEAYPEEDDPVSWINIRLALASFQRTLISVDSPYDAYTRGDDEAISESAKRGAALFFSEALECHHCHGSFNFTHSTVHENTAFTSRPFENTGLYNIGGDGSYPVDGLGLYRFTLDPSDEGKFRPPTLRNISVTGPYMHDGSMDTLGEVLDFYAAGGRNIEDGRYAGDGRSNPNKSSFVSGFPMSDQDREDLIAFLESLTDEDFLTNPNFSDPW
ncbi:MAG: MbnH family di-heme enzyme [Myxococcota bacterium]